MVWSWIDLILFGCSGNQATILLEALVLMTILVDLMVGSIQLGLMGTREEEASSSKSSTDLTNLLKQSVKQTGSSSSVKSITRSPSLLQLSYSAYSLQANVRSVRACWSLHQVIEFDSHDRIDLQIYSLHYV